MRSENLIIFRLPFTLEQLGQLGAPTFYTNVRSVSCSVVSDSATAWTVAFQAPLTMGFSRQENVAGPPYNMPVFFHMLGSTVSRALVPTDSANSTENHVVLWYLLLGKICFTSGPAQSKHRLFKCQLYIYLSFLIIKKYKKMKSHTLTSITTSVLLTLPPFLHIWEYS